MAPAASRPKLSEHDREKIQCKKPSCRGSCPRWLLCSAWMEGATIAKPRCRECNRQYDSPGKGPISNWTRRCGERTDEIANEVRRKEANANNKHAKEAEQRFKELERRNRELEQKLKESERRGRAKAEEDDKDDGKEDDGQGDQQLRDEIRKLDDHIKAVTRQIEDDAYLDDAKPHLRAAREVAQQRKKELEQRRDATKSPSSRLQRAEADLRKAEGALRAKQEEIQESEEAIYKEVCRHTDLKQQLADLQATKRECENTVRTIHQEAAPPDTRVLHAQGQAAAFEKASKRFTEKCNAAVATNPEHKTAFGVFEAIFAELWAEQKAEAAEATAEAAAPPPPPPPASPTHAEGAGGAATGVWRRIPRKAPQEGGKPEDGPATGDGERQSGEDEDDDDSMENKDGKAKAEELTKATAEWIRSKPERAQFPAGEEGEKAHKEAIQRWSAESPPQTPPTKRPNTGQPAGNGEPRG